MRSRKNVGKTKTKTKTNTIKQRGNTTNQRATTINVKLPADRTLPRMMGFNPYAYVIEIPKQPHQNMIAQAVNGVSAVEQLARSARAAMTQQNTAPQNVFQGTRTYIDHLPRPPSSRPSPSNANYAAPKKRYDLRRSLDRFDFRHASPDSSGQSKREVLAIATEYQERSNEPGLQRLLDKRRTKNHYIDIYNYLKNKL